MNFLAGRSTAIPSRELFFHLCTEPSESAQRTTLAVLPGEARRCRWRRLTQTQWRADEPAKVSLGWYGQMIAHTDEEREVAQIDEEDELVDRKSVV